jgi:uncharacterized protein
MILGKIVGKITTTKFNFLVTNSNAKKFQFVQVSHPDYNVVLCQILELIRNNGETIAHCSVIGFKDDDDRLLGIRVPFVPGVEVLSAEPEFVAKMIKINKDSAYVGKLEGMDLPVHIDLQKLLTKHLAVLAKSGAGKSYCVGVLLEEILEKNVPLLIIDPHGEYSSLKYPSENNTKLAQWNIEAKGYGSMLQIYGDFKQNPELKPLKLNEDMTSYELMKWLPLSLSSTQEAILFSVIKDLEEINFDSIILGLEQINSNHKWALLDMVWHLKGQEIFSQSPTPLNEIIKPGKCSIINLKGMNPEIQSMVVGKLLMDLFSARKKGKITPFFCVLEEAHNFVPEKGFGTAKSSEVIRLISSEGRKFGVGLCVVSQRPALVQKTVLAQCSMQIILKITNPNDLRMIGNSVEGINAETLEEVQHLAIGSALVCGVVDRPLVVNIRQRRTKHGGDAINVLEVSNEKNKIVKELNKEVDGKIGLNDFEKEKITNKNEETKQEQSFEDENLDLDEKSKEELLPLIKPKISIKDRSLMEEQKIKSITTFLIPAIHVFCEVNGEEFPILIDLIRGNIVIDPDTEKTAPLHEVSRDVAFLTKPVYEKIKYDKILDKNIDVDEIISRLKENCKIKDYNECYILYYQIEF